MTVWSAVKTTERFGEEIPWEVFHLSINALSLTSTFSLEDTKPIRSSKDRPKDDTSEILEIMK